MVALSLAEVRLSLIARLSALMIGVGVLAGASIPCHKVSDSSDRPLSVMVGTSGSCGLRVALVIASALSLPSRISGRMVAAVPK
jgi:hypothetical protein